MYRKYRFYKDELGWFIDLKWFPFNRGFLAMIAGADILLDKLSNNQKEVILKITSIRPKENNYEDCIIRQQKLGLLNGAVYKTVINKLPNSGVGKNKLWLCAVTLLIFGRYPRKIYFKKVK